MSEKDAQEIAYLSCGLLGLMVLQQLWAKKVKPLVLTVVHPSAADQAPLITAGPVQISKVDAAGMAVMIALSYLLVRLVIRKVRSARKAADATT